MFDATGDGWRRHAFEELIVGRVDAGSSYAFEAREERREAVVDGEEVHRRCRGENRHANLAGQLCLRHQVEEGFERAGVERTIRGRCRNDDLRGADSGDRVVDLSGRCAREQRIGGQRCNVDQVGIEA